jgi:hypothetical protein
MTWSPLAQQPIEKHERWLWAEDAKRFQTTAKRLQDCQNTTLAMQQALLQETLEEKVTLTQGALCPHFPKAALATLKCSLEVAPEGSTALQQRAPRLVFETWCCQLHQARGGADEALKRCR